MSKSSRNLRAVTTEQRKSHPSKPPYPGNKELTTEINQATKKLPANESDKSHKTYRQ